MYDYIFNKEMQTYKADNHFKNYTKQDATNIEHKTFNLHFL